METLVTNINPQSVEFRENRTDMLEMLGEMELLLEEVEGGGGEEHMNRLRNRGKLPIRERVAAVLDRDSPFLELSALAAWSSSFPVGLRFHLRHWRRVRGRVHHHRSRSERTCRRHQRLQYQEADACARDLS